MIDPEVFARSFDELVVLVAIGLLWPLRYIWAYPVVIILLGLAAVNL
jgi:hypothetical protein